MSRIINRPFINDTQDLIQVSLLDFAKQFQTCIPAIVKKVISRDCVVVSPAVLQSDGDKNPIEWADVKTTVLTPFSGGIFLSMPLSVGDTGWLVASDLDTSIFKMKKKPSQQKIYTRHLYQYGFFVPDAINGYSVSEDDAGAVVLSTLDGKTKIALKDKEINVVSDDVLKINAKSITITSSGNNVTIDGVNFKTHKHEAGTLVAPNGAVTGITGGVDA